MNRTPLEAWIAGVVAGDATEYPTLAFDRAVLERYQLDRLRQSIGLARDHSTFYRRHLAAADDLASLDDLRRLPFTTADDIRADPLGLVCVPQDEISRVVTLDSSGTSGAPKRLYFTRADQALTIDFFAVGMATFTGPADRVLILLPGDTPGSVGDLLATAIERLGAVPIKHGPVRDVASARRAAESERATVIVGVPTHLLRLVRQEPGWSVPSLHSVLLSTDHVPAAIVTAIETTLDCRVYNHYGMTEMGLGGGVDCAARRGYHLREADLLFEIVHPAGDEQAPEGEVGEIVFSTLTRRGMPLVRYRTGDLGRWLLDPCPCGTGLRTLAHVTTRVAGRVSIGRGAPITQADLDEAVFAVDGVLDFAACVSRSDASASLEVRVQVAPDSDPERVRDRVIHGLHSVPALEGAESSGDPAWIEVVAVHGPVSGPTLAKRAIAVRDVAAREAMIVRDQVSDYYGNVVQSTGDLVTRACRNPTTERMPRHHRDALALIHPEILDRTYGCGSPIPPAIEGLRVLDLGCGSGRDAYLCSRLVGPTGSVVGVDMTDAQLAVARRHVDWQMARFGYAKPNVEFRTGNIEDLDGCGMADGSVDVVISNCVINLAARKDRVMAEVFRVLRPGGELYFSDIFADRRIPPELEGDPVLRGECLAGAMYVEDFRRLMRRAGCLDHRVVSRRRVELANEAIEAKIGVVGFSSMTVRAFKLPDLEDVCEDYGQVARYQGTIEGMPHRFTLDDHHEFVADKATLVCGNTAAMLTGTRFARHFRVAGDRSAHFGPFGCGSGTGTAIEADPPIGGACC